MQTADAAQLPLIPEKTMSKFQSASELASTKSHRRAGARTRTNANLIFTTTSLRVTDDNPFPRTSLVFAIYPDLIKQARWQEGDRIDVLYDKSDRTGLLKRVPKGGYALTARGQQAHSAMQVKFTWYEGMPYVDEASDVIEYTLTEEGILFSFPENTTFERRSPV
jgi:hypothetical protein